jgi:hypothetical protein
MRRFASGGEGVDLDKGLLACIDDIDDEGVMNRELRARVKFPSMFWKFSKHEPRIGPQQLTSSRFLAFARIISALLLRAALEISSVVINLLSFRVMTFACAISTSLSYPSSKILSSSSPWKFLSSTLTPSSKSLNISAACPSVVTVLFVSTLTDLWWLPTLVCFVVVSHVLDVDGRTGDSRPPARVYNLGFLPGVLSASVTSPMSESMVPLP